MKTQNSDLSHEPLDLHTILYRLVQFLHCPVDPCNALLSHLINIFKAITALGRYVPRRTYVLLASFHSDFSEDCNCYWIIRAFAHVSLAKWNACIVCLITVSVVRKTQSNTSPFCTNNSLWQLFRSKQSVLNNWLFNLTLSKQSVKCYLCLYL